MKLVRLKDYILTRGDTFYRIFSFTLRTPEGREPINLTEYPVISIDIRKGITKKGELMASLSLFNGGITITGDNNNILELLYFDTENWKGGDYFYDIRFTDNTNKTFTYSWGKLIVRENITEL